MRGSYQYAPMKLILAKVLQNKRGNRTTPGDSEDILAFVDGDYMQYNLAHIELLGLSTGEYVLFLQAEWDLLNPLRKLIMNIYAPDPIEIVRVPTNSGLTMLLETMDQMLNNRLEQGFDYQTPSYAI